jgi:hypothetical protein
VEADKNGGDMERDGGESDTTKVVEMCSGINEWLHILDSKSKRARDAPSFICEHGLFYSSMFTLSRKENPKHFS